MSRQAHGLRAWLLQRFTAVYIGCFLIYVTVRFWLNPLQGYAGWKQWLSAPLVNLATGLFITTVLIHAWVGVRDIIMDYIHPTGLRVVLMGLVALLLAGCGLWSLRVLFVLVY